MSAETRETIIAGFVQLVRLAIITTWPVLLGFSSHVWTELSEHDKRIEVMESNRYTDQEAAEDRAVLTAQIESVRRDQATTDIYLREIVGRLERMDGKMTRFLERQPGMNGVD